MKVKNKKECETAFIAFAVNVAYKMCLGKAQKEGVDFTPKNGRKIEDISSFEEYLIDNDFTDIASALFDYLTKDEVHPFEARQALARQRKENDAKAVAEIYSAFLPKM